MENEEPQKSSKASKLTTALSVLLCIDILLWLPLVLSTDGGELGLYFLSVGQGDSQLIVLEGGQKILIDAGPGSAVVSQLERILGNNTYIDLAIMTHPELDHFGGFIDVLKRYRIGAFLSTGRVSESGSFAALQQSLAEHAVPQVTLREGDAIAVGNAQLRVLSPSRKELRSKEHNDTSLVLMLEAPQLRALYTGDIGFEVESRIRSAYDLDADILKVPHHGSKFSSGQAFISEVSPAIAIVGVGKNSYGHPTDQALSRIQVVTDQIFTTQLAGSIKILFEDGLFSLSSSH